MFNQKRKEQRTSSILQTIKGDDTHYFISDKRHREEQKHNLILPAVINFEIKMWYKNNKLHRSEKDENGLTLPAVIWSDESKEWWKNDERHRYDRDENGRVLPAVIWSDGTIMYWVNGAGV